MRTLFLFLFRPLQLNLFFFFSNSSQALDFALTTSTCQVQRNFALARATSTTTINIRRTRTYRDGTPVICQSSRSSCVAWTSCCRRIPRITPTVWSTRRCPSDRAQREFPASLRSRARTTRRPVKLNSAGCRRNGK